MANSNDKAYLLQITDDAADNILENLSSETTRSVVQYLSETTATPSEIADATDNSIQNVNYHLTKLVDADIAESVGSQYSEKRTEMEIYGLKYDPLVIVVGEKNPILPFKRILSIVGVWVIGFLAATGGFKLLINYLPEILSSKSSEDAISLSSVSAGPLISPVVAFAFGGFVGVLLAILVVTRLYRN
ncbi:ArsR/SmtB family transcription factor [Haloarchaeobius sp. FL176]|uniref:ArsR/SmtB family transcription factor n=1 Tax=Haloarchaeobius TaxID=1269031 RepID=UPI00214739FA|nr:helix-turn-helix domain-containing protein [Haloarchaeobius sp. FL176]